jgi:hypothetical protein
MLCVSNIPQTIDNGEHNTGVIRIITHSSPVIFLNEGAPLLSVKCFLRFGALFRSKLTQMYVLNFSVHLFYTS